MSSSLMKVSDVSRQLSISERSIWRMVAAGTFPKPIRIGTRSVRWKAEDVERYVRERSPEDSVKGFERRVG